MISVADILAIDGGKYTPAKHWLDEMDRIKHNDLWAVMPQARYMLYWCYKKKLRFDSEYRQFASLCAARFDDIRPITDDQLTILPRVGVRLARELGRSQPLMAACGVSQAMELVAMTLSCHLGEQEMMRAAESEQLRQADILRSIIPVLP